MVDVTPFPCLGTSWNFRNVYFMDEMLDQNEPEHFPDIPPYLHRMQHVYRSANYTKPGQYVELPLTNKNQIVIARSQNLHTLTYQNWNYGADEHHIYQQAGTCISCEDLRVYKSDKK